MPYQILATNMLKGCLLVLSTTHHTNVPTKPARASPVANSETPGTFCSCKITKKNYVSLDRDADSRTGFNPVNCAGTKNDSKKVTESCLW